MVPRKNPRGGQRREQSGRRSRTRLDWGARSNTWSIGLSCVGLLVLRPTWTRRSTRESEWTTAPGHHGRPPLGDRSFGQSCPCSCKRPSRPALWPACRFCLAERPSDLAASMRSASARPTASCSFNAPRGSSTRLRRRLSSRSRVGGRGAPADMVGPGSRARSHCEPAVPPRTAMHIARSSRRTVGVLTVDQAVLASEGRNDEKRRLCRHLS